MKAPGKFGQIVTLARVPLFVARNIFFLSFYLPARAWKWSCLQVRGRNAQFLGCGGDGQNIRLLPHCKKYCRNRGPISIASGCFPRFPLTTPTKDTSKWFCRLVLLPIARMKMILIQMALQTNKRKRTTQEGLYLRVARAQQLVTRCPFMLANG